MSAPDDLVMRLKAPMLFSWAATTEQVAELLPLIQQRAEAAARIEADAAEIARLTADRDDYKQRWNAISRELVGETGASAILTAATIRQRVADLEAALRLNNVRALLRAYEPFIREAAGNTNYQAAMDEVAAAAAAIAKEQKA